MKAQMCGNYLHRAVPQCYPPSGTVGEVLNVEMPRILSEKDETFYLIEWPMRSGVKFNTYLGGYIYPAPASSLRLMEE